MFICCLFFIILPGTKALADIPPNYNPNDPNSTDVSSVEPEVAVNRVDPTDDTNTIYERYKDNSFELMTKEYESLNGFKKMFVNSTGLLKNFSWGGVFYTGLFNTELVKFMYSLDVISPLKNGLKSMTATIAGSMLSIAGTVAIIFVSFVMAFKFMAEQKMKSVFRIFFMTIAIFTCLVLLKDINANGSIIDKALNLDSAIEREFLKINPVFDGVSIDTKEDDTSEETISSTGDLIATKIFRSNIYEPYLLFQYGTTDMEAIRSKEVEYKGNSYDRIGILLDNDVRDDSGTALIDAVTKYEANTLKNRTIMYTSNFGNAIFGVFYFCLNLIQMVVFFILAMLRLMIQFLQAILFPMAPIILLVGLFNFENNVFKNYIKAFLITVLAKAMCGFATIFFATYISLGYASSSLVDNPFQKILTIVVYAVVPFAVYLFRHFLGAMFAGRLTVGDAMQYMMSPRRMNKMYKQAEKTRKDDKKARKNDAKNKKKEEQEKNNKKDGGSNKNGLNEQKNRNNKDKSDSRKPKENENKDNNHAPDLNKRNKNDTNKPNSNENKKDNKTEGKGNRQSPNRSAKRNAPVVVPLVDKKAKAQTSQSGNTQLAKNNKFNAKPYSNARKASTGADRSGRMSSKVNSNTEAIQRIKSKARANKGVKPKNEKVSQSVNVIANQKLKQGRSRRVTPNAQPTIRSPRTGKTIPTQSGRNRNQKGRPSTRGKVTRTVNKEIAVQRKTGRGGSSRNSKKMSNVLKESNRNSQQTRQINKNARVPRKRSH